VLHDPTVPSSGAALPRHAIFGASLLERPAGVTVGAVLPGSPAAGAGVLAGDVIQSIANVRTPNVASFLAMMHRLAAGNEVRLAVVRKNTPVVLHVRLAAAPDEHDPQVSTIYGAINFDNSLRRTLLTVPRDATARQPGVLIIGGIGCYSVDVASNAEDAYLRLTHDLSRAGFVTMRLEKSGVGDSQGPPCPNVDFAAESASYAAALDALKRDPHVDPKRIYLIGHSIGSIIAPRLALSNPVAGIVVVAAVGRDWPEYELRNARRQLELSGTPPADVDTSVMQKASCMQRLLVEREPEAQIERTMPYCKVPNGVYPVTASYVRQVAALNIIQPWTQLRVPVLAIYGSSDFVTEEPDHRRIVDILNAAQPGRATLTIIPGMDHYLARAASQKISLDNVQNGKREIYDDDLSHAVLAWLSGH
jgi:alpha-beta hydrolase superfamily lysophospholipase